MEDKKMHSNVRSAKVIEVIEVVELCGTGTGEDPVRLCCYYYKLNGTKLCEEIITSSID